MDRFDLVVIGAGASGEAAAHYAPSQVKASVAIIDRALFGGSCPFWACMPSKALSTRLLSGRAGKTICGRKRRTSATT